MNFYPSQSFKKIEQNKVIKNIAIIPQEFSLVLQNISPINFGLKDTLTNKISIQERIIAFINYLYSVKQQRISDNQILNANELPIHVDIWEYYFPNNYKLYKTFLNENKVLSICSDYKKGEYSTHYIFYKSYFESKDLWIAVNFQDKNKSNLTSNTYSSNTLVDKRYEDTIKNIQIDINSAILDDIKNVDKNMPQKLFYKIARIISFYNKTTRSINISPKQSRIFNSCSHLSEIARKHLFVIENYKCIPVNNYVDLTNSQPLFLYVYFKNKYKDKYEDEAYREAITSGNFYSLFLNIKYNKYDRDQNITISNYLIKDKKDCKSALYSKIFFSFDENSSVSLRFKELFGPTYELLKDEKELSLSLQFLETSLFMKAINTMKSNYLYTIHDAIYFSDRTDCRKIKMHCNQYFKKYNISPKFN